jgi:TetR/AcrR family transcriptional regulator, cholesterol catabolism regulator
VNDETIPTSIEAAVPLPPRASGRNRRPRRTSTPGTYAPAETRRALLDSAIELFDRYGFAETSVQAIVDNANLTKGAFYHHFDVKEEVLCEIQAEYIDHQVEEVERVIASSNDPVEQLRGLVRQSVRAVSTHRAHVSVFLQERRYLTGERFAAVKARRDIVEERFVDVIRRGIESGAFRPQTHPRVIAFAIIGMGAWVQQWFDERGRLDVDQVADMFWDLISDGLVTPT